MIIPALFEAFSRTRVLVIGDVMIDSYIWGKVSRISPEAPVPVVNVTKREQRLGGAANVALNIKSLGAAPILCSVVGDDQESLSFDKLLEENGLSNEGIIKSKSRITTVKHRVLAGSQHLLRVDTETDKQINEEESVRLVERVKSLLPKVDVIIFEDYDKGVLHPQVIGQIITMANQMGVPTVVDPKKRNFLAYQYCTLFKPNLKELKEGLKFDFDTFSIDALREGMKILEESLHMQIGMVTLSEHGIFISNQQEEHHLPAHKREIADVSGAGDTVVSIAALCLAHGFPLDKIAGISNLGGGLVCEYLGVVPINREKLLAEASKYYA